MGLRGFLLPDVVASMVASSLTTRPRLAPDLCDACHKIFCGADCESSHRHSCRLACRHETCVTAVVTTHDKDF